MAWDKVQPTDATIVASLDTVLQANWAYLRDAIRQEHADPDANPSAPAQIVHLQGSGRVIVYTGATVLDSSADVVAAVTQLYHDTRDIGRTVIDQNTSATPGGVWYCVDTDTFVEVSRLWSAVTFANSITVAAGKQIIGPTGESWIANGAAASMNPLLHAARHAVGGDDPFLAGIAQSVVYKTNSNNYGSGDDPVDMLEHTFDFSGRAGDTTVLVLVKAQARYDEDSGGSITSRLYVRLGTDQKSKDIRCEIDHSGSTDDNFRVPVFGICAFAIPNLAAQAVRFHLFSLVATNATAFIDQPEMLILDLGSTTLTTP